MIMLFSVFGAAVAQGTVNLVTTATLTMLSSGSYQANVNVSNNGTGTAQNIVLSTALLGSAAGTPAPQSLGSIPANGVASAVFTFSASAGASGAAVVERYTGSYSGGTFGGSIRAVLPGSPASIAQLNALIAQAQALETGNAQFPLQVSHTANGSDVNQAFPWVYASEFNGLDVPLKAALNALISWNAQAITNLQNAITTFTGEIKANGTDPYYRLDPGLGKQLITLTAATNVWTLHKPPLDNRIPADGGGSTFTMIPYPFADSAGQAPVLLINYVDKDTTTFAGVSMQSPLSPVVNVPAGSTIEFDVYYCLSDQGKFMRWHMTNRSTTVDSYLRAYDYTSLNPTWIGSYNGDTWFKTHVSANIPQTGSSSTFILELHGENGRPAETGTLMVQNLKIMEPDPNATALPNVVNSQYYNAVAPLKSLYNTGANQFMVGAIGTGTVNGIRAWDYEIFVDGNNLKADATQPNGPSWLTSTTGAALSGANSTGLAQFSFPDSSYTQIRDSGTPGQYKIHGHVMAWYNQAPAWMEQITPATLPQGYNGTPNFYSLGNGVTTQVLVSTDMARRVQFNHIVYLMRHFLTTSTFYGSSVSRGVVPFNDWDMLNEEIHESNFSVNIPADPNSWRASLKSTNWLSAMSDNLINGDLKDHYVYLLFKFGHIAAPNAQMAAAFKANYASLPAYMKLDGHDDNGSIDAYIQANPPKLAYNDYSYNTNAKARTVYNMVLALNTAWLSDPLYDGRPLIELIGSETHDSVGATEASDNQYALALFAKLVDQGLLTGISSSEFDLVMGTNAPGGGQTAPAALNIRQSDALGYQYALMYKLFSKFAPYMNHVISWGTSGSGWQGSYVLFDGNSDADSGYYGAMNPDRYILGHSYLDYFFSGEYNKLQYGYPIDLGDLGIYTR
jgi:GH35 family endo-1,4-beta-xylanase